jgi:hypothetical protein
MAVNTFSSALAETESSNLTGGWKIEITLANEQRRFVRFDAQSDGKAL